MAQSLYERLGKHAGIKAIMDDVVTMHLENPVVAPRFRQADADYLRKMACDFMCAGSGGPETYSGKDMRTAHKGMNVSEQEFVAVVDDILAALDKHGVGAAERQEVLSILYSMKNDVVRL